MQSYRRDTQQWLKEGYEITWEDSDDFLSHSPLHFYARHPSPKRGYLDHERGLGCWQAIQPIWCAQCYQHHCERVSVEYIPWKWRGYGQLDLNVGQILTRNMLKNTVSGWWGSCSWSERTSFQHTMSRKRWGCELPHLSIGSCGLRSSRRPKKKIPCGEHGWRWRLAQHLRRMTLTRHQYEGIQWKSKLKMRA